MDKPDISIVTAIDPPWTDVVSIRLGAVPRGLGTPDLFVLVAFAGRPSLRLDLYRADDSESYLRDEVIQWRSWIVVGFGYRVFLVDAHDHRVREIALPLYFEGVRASEEYLLILNGQGLVRVDPSGRVVWSKDRLAIDGVAVDAIEDGVIRGRGEWDPPGGWRPFRVRLDTGELIPQPI